MTMIRKTEMATDCSIRILFRLSVFVRTNCFSRGKRQRSRSCPEDKFSLFCWCSPYWLSRWLNYQLVSTMWTQRPSAHCKTISRCWCRSGVFSTRSSSLPSSALPLLSLRRSIKKQRKYRRGNHRRRVARTDGHRFCSVNVSSLLRRSSHLESLGGIMLIFAICAMIFFVLLQVRVFRNYSRVQSTNPTLNTYCLPTIFFGAFGLIIATYVAFLLAFAVTAVLLLGIGIAK